MSSTGHENKTQDETHDTNRQKAAPGASWKAKEAHVLPKNRLGIVRFSNISDRFDRRKLCQVFFGLMATVFLAAIDQVWVPSYPDYTYLIWKSRQSLQPHYLRL